MSNNNNYYHRGMVDYTSRDYESIMNDFWDLVPKMTELWKPEADSDPGVVLGKFLASCANVLGVNVDWLANEIFAPTVSQRKNAEKLFSLIGYELGWYSAARTEVSIRNNSDNNITFDFGFNGSNFCTLNAYSDITGQARTITYNILPMTNTYGASNSRAHRSTTTTSVNYFVDHDKVVLQPGESVTRVAIEGELRYYSVSVGDVKSNNYIINLPSQHIDTTAVWIKAKSSRSSSDYLSTQWLQCASPSEFITPEPRYAVTYDNYSNAQIQISSYLNQLENYDDGTYLVVYWFDTSGAIGCVSTNTLSNYLQANPDDSIPEESSGEYSISNLSNIVELPHTNTVQGKSPETAKEAYYNSRNYINTWDSLITLPDFNRFLNREPGIDCGIVIDCQKALDTNLAIYNDTNLSSSQKQKMYINNYDFPVGDETIDWAKYLDTDTLVTKTTHRVLPGQTLEQIAQIYGTTVEDICSYNEMAATDKLFPGYMLKIPTANNVEPKIDFTINFQTYTAMCFAIHNDFAASSDWGEGKTSVSKIQNRKVFVKYRPPQELIDQIIRDYRPLQAMTVQLQFGDVRVFNWYVVGQIYTKSPVSKDVGNNIIANAKTALALYFAPSNRKMGQKPTTMEVVDVIENSDSRISYFDAGSLRNPVINWNNCDEDYFNIISFARYLDPGSSATNIRIAPECLI